MLRVHRIDPQHMKVISAGRSRERRESLAAIGGAIHGCLRDINYLWVARINEDAAEIAAAFDPGIFGSLRPGSAAIVRLKQTLRGDGKHRIPLRSRSNRNANASH